jgi:hypothetical protein
MGTVLELDRLGKVVSRSGKAARQVGYLLFFSLPPRLDVMVLNIRIVSYFNAIERNDCDNHGAVQAAASQAKRVCAEREARVWKGLESAERLCASALCTRERRGAADVHASAERRVSDLLCSPTAFALGS